MMRRDVLAGLSVLSLLAAVLLAAPCLAQDVDDPAMESAASPPEDLSASSQPAVAPQAYRIQLNNLLIYHVVISSRSSQNPNQMERTDRRELAVFDVEESGKLVLYIGTPREEHQTATPAPAAVSPPLSQQHPRSQASPVRTPGSPQPTADTKPDKPKSVEMNWKKYVVGTPDSRAEDGTVTIRPEPSVLAYPVLPLPPQETRAKEKFDVTMPDIAIAGDRTLDLTAQWQAAGAEKIAVTARLEPKITPGVPFVPEMAFFKYEVARENPPAVVQMNESRKLPGERPATTTRPATTERPVARPGAGTSTPRPRPANSGPAPVTVAIRLDKTVSLTEDQHKAMILVAAGGAGQGTASTVAPAEPNRASSNSVIQDLIEQLRN